MPVNSQKTMTPTECRQPNSVTLFIYNWAASNIFRFKSWDSFLYVLLYIIVPVSITWVGVSVSVEKFTTLANCYFSVMINAANCFYDAVGRWDSNMPTKKIKIWLIIIPCIIVFSYGLIQLTAIIGLDTTALRNDKILYWYLPAVVVAVIDVVAVVNKPRTLDKALLKIVSD